MFPFCVTDIQILLFIPLNRNNRVFLQFWQEQNSGNQTHNQHRSSSDIPVKTISSNSVVPLFTWRRNFTGIVNRSEDSKQRKTTISK